MRFLHKFGIRLKLIGILMISLGFGLMTIGSIIYFQIRSFVGIRVEEALEHHAELVEQSLDPDKISERDLAYLKNFVEQTSLIAHYQLTLVDTGGKILVDSKLLRSNFVPEDAYWWPEVLAASSESDSGSVWMPTSVTRNNSLIYIIKSVKLDSREVGYFRLALQEGETDDMLARVRFFFFSGGALILLFSTMLVILLSRRISQNLYELIQKANMIAGGDLQVRIKVESQDELSELGCSLNEMAIKLSEYLKKLSRERQELNTVLSSVDEAIIAIDANKKVVFFNKIALQLLKSDTKEITRKYYYQVIPDQHLNSLINTFFEKPFLVSDEIYTDEEHVLGVTIAPFSIENKINKGAVVVIRDVTQYKKLEKIRRDFVANVSHEFKTPLAAIRGYAETLSDWGLEDPQVSRKYVERIIKQSHLLENLVSDLLQLARIERLQNIELKPFRPDPVIRDVVNEYSETAENRNIQLTVQLATESIYILGDPEMFRSIIANLIDNAMKYSNYANGKILVFSEIDVKHGVFSVKDNGMGIPAREQKRVFERFYRVDKARSRSIGGTGLGLSIVKHLTELQQAKVWVDSIEDKGSCFSVKFKIASSK